MTDDDLYERAYELVDRNEMIYNEWESYIAKRFREFGFGMANCP
jgi:hypothetical protein